MAYLNLLVSVRPDELQAYLENLRTGLRGSQVEGASHILASCVQLEPLRTYLAEAMDGGQPLHPNLWHPFRKPIVHSQGEVRVLSGKLNAEWQRVWHDRPEDVPDDDWYAVQITKVLRVFCYAAENNELVVSALDAGPGVRPPGHFRFKLLRNGSVS